MEIKILGFGRKNYLASERVVVAALAEMGGPGIMRRYERVFSGEWSCMLLSECEYLLKKKERPSNQENATEKPISY